MIDATFIKWQKVWCFLLLSKTWTNYSIIKQSIYISWHVFWPFKMFVFLWDSNNCPLKHARGMRMIMQSQTLVWRDSQTFSLNFYQLWKKKILQPQAKPNSPCASTPTDIKNPAFFFKKSMSLEISCTWSAKITMVYIPLTDTQLTFTSVFKNLEQPCVRGPNVVYTSPHYTTLGVKVYSE